MTEPNKITHPLDLQFHCEKEARSGDEITFMLNHLEQSLNDVKMKNHFNLSQLATKVEQNCALDDAQIYNCSVGISGIENIDIREISRIRLSQINNLIQL